VILNVETLKPQCLQAKAQWFIDLFCPLKNFIVEQQIVVVSAHNAHG
jgi:hypothetical protein